MKTFADSLAGRSTVGKLKHSSQTVTTKQRDEGLTAREQQGREVNSGDAYLVAIELGCRIAVCASVVRMSTSDKEDGKRRENRR
jgi:hypothetical protein